MTGQRSTPPRPPRAPTARPKQASKALPAKKPQAPTLRRISKRPPKEARASARPEAAPPARVTVSAAPEPIVVGAHVGAPTVLVVDDDDSVRMLTVRVLKVAGYTVYEAAGGARALRVLERIPTPSCILMDIMMPEIDGLEVVKRLKGSPNLASVPVIFVTAKGAPADVLGGINLGARHYLVKPFKMKDLLDKVAHLVAASERIA